MDLPVLAAQPESPASAVPAGSTVVRPTVQPKNDPLWWRNAVIYQIYIRSFADANGDGDRRPGRRRAKLGYLKELGVDALWFNPWYPSPMADGGYDVADYRAIDPAFGTLEEAEALIQEALAARHPDDHRRRPQPHLRPARLVPGRR